MSVQELKWWDLGACRGLDASVFYPDDDEGADVAEVGLRRLLGAGGMSRLCAVRAREGRRVGRSHRTRPATHDPPTPPHPLTPPGSRRRIGFRRQRGRPYHRGDVEFTAVLAVDPVGAARRDGPRRSPTASDGDATILRGDATAAQIAGFLVALRAKGEHVDELTGLLDAALDEATFVPLTDDERVDASTSSAQAATGRTRSTSRRWRRS